jgi:hypothetical protein
MEPQICVFTCIYGTYEKTCKQYVPQTIPCDFICFTDNPVIDHNNWIIDTTPYHIVNPSPLDSGDGYCQINSFANNHHPSLIPKYYKQAFKNIPRMKKYDMVIWMDGTLEIISDKMVEWIFNKMNTIENKIILWENVLRDGILKEEVDSSNFAPYTSTFWNGHEQPYQDIYQQYDVYLKNGYTDEYFKKRPENKSRHFGLWSTGFMAIDNRDDKVSRFLDDWHMETLCHTTQCQMGFSYICFKHEFIPYTLPDEDFEEGSMVYKNKFFIFHSHGK